MAFLLPEYLAHLRIILSCLLMAHQAAMLDSSALDALALH
jgi:hypothetical protein